MPGRRCLLAVKLDTWRAAPEVCFSLGFGDPVGVSAAIGKSARRSSSTPLVERRPHVTNGRSREPSRGVVGRPNVGQSHWSIASSRSASSCPKTAPTVGRQSTPFLRFQVNNPLHLIRRLTASGKIENLELYPP